MTSHRHHADTTGDARRRAADSSNPKRCSTRTTSSSCSSRSCSTRTRRARWTQRLDGADVASSRRSSRSRTWRARTQMANRCSVQRRRPDRQDGHLHRSRRQTSTRAPSRRSAPQGGAPSLTVAGTAGVDPSTITQVA